MVGHHLEEVVGLGGHLARDVKLHLVDVMLEFLLNKSASRLDLIGVLGLQLEWIGSVCRVQRLGEERKHCIKCARVREIKLLVQKNAWNVQFRWWWLWRSFQ